MLLYIVLVVCLAVVVEMAFLPPSSRFIGDDNRLSLVEWSGYSYQDNEGTGSYSFGYDIEDSPTDNVQFRKEERHTNGTVTGSYGYLQPDGTLHIVHYVADASGYRAVVESSDENGQVNPPMWYGYDHVDQDVPSSELVGALANLKVFRRQQLLDRRTRPIDTYNAPYIS